jgi:Spy/CpxP family protein refolding chaperone
MAENAGYMNKSDRDKHMARQTTWVLALLVACTASVAGAPAFAQSQEKPQKASAHDGERREQRDRWKWWLYNRDELGITDQQSAAINGIFESTITKLRETRQEADRTESELSRTIKEGTADVTVVSHLVDRFEAARSENNKIRVLMLYRMHRELRPDQLRKVQELLDSRRRERDSDRKR